MRQKRGSFYGRASCFSCLMYITGRESVIVIAFVVVINWKYCHTYEIFGWTRKCETLEWLRAVTFYVIYAQFIPSLLQVAVATNPQIWQCPFSRRYCSVGSIVFDYFKTMRTNLQQTEIPLDSKWQTLPTGYPTTRWMKLPRLWKKRMLRGNGCAMQVVVQSTMYEDRWRPRYKADSSHKNSMTCQEWSLNPPMSRFLKQSTRLPSCKLYVSLPCRRSQKIWSILLHAEEYKRRSWSLGNRMASEFQRSEVARNVRTTYYGSLTINF